MCIDDGLLDNYVVTKILELSGMSRQTISFRSAGEALEYLERNAETPSLIPDIILLDIQMPDMTGFDFLEAYGSLPEKVTGRCDLFLLSSSIDRADKSLAECSEFVRRMLIKPLNIEELKAFYDNEPDAA